MPPWYADQRHGEQGLHAKHGISRVGPMRRRLGAILLTLTALGCAGPEPKPKPPAPVGPQPARITIFDATNHRPVLELLCAYAGCNVLIDPRIFTGQDEIEADMKDVLLKEALFELFPAAYLNHSGSLLLVSSEPVDWGKPGVPAPWTRRFCRCSRVGRSGGRTWRASFRSSIRGSRPFPTGAV